MMQKTTATPKVWLAPMSGATDSAFRKQVVRFGGRAVVSEMVAGEMLIAERKDVMRKVRRHEGEAAWIVQLAGRLPDDMRKSAAWLADAGVDVIDINMGCPSRQVTGGASGSALMKTPDVAKAIIDATIEGANGRPVTLKMRLGWDADSLNAPELAKYAEQAGISMITVHGRTRCQFYKGVADWLAVRSTVNAVTLPVICNGDIRGTETARNALEQSGAHGVMIGRASLGRPWLIAEIDTGLRGEHYHAPNLSDRLTSIADQIEDSCTLYGETLGIRIVRKHVSSVVEHDTAFGDDGERRRFRADVCKLNNPSEMIAALRRQASGGTELLQ